MVEMPKGQSAASEGLGSLRVQVDMLRGGDGTTCLRRKKLNTEEHCGFYKEGRVMLDRIYEWHPRVRDLISWAHPRLHSDFPYGYF